MAYELIQHLSKSLGIISKVPLAQKPCPQSLPLTLLNSESAEVQSTEKEPQKRIEELRKFLRLILSSPLKTKNRKMFNQFKECWFDFYASHLGEEFQLEQAYLYLTAHLLGLTFEPQKNPIYSESGYAPLHTCVDYPQLHHPALDSHAELGIIWAILGHKLKSEVYLNAALKVSNWQQGALEYSLLPFKGFFSTASNSCYANLLLVEGVLFLCAAHLKRDPESAFIAKRHFYEAMETKGLYKNPQSYHFFYLLNWLEALFESEPTPHEPKLSVWSLDSSDSFVGYRKERLSVMASLAGCNSSMGSVHYDDVSINAFSPQVGHLGESDYFGFLGSSLLKNSIDAQHKLDREDHFFSLQGTVGLPNNKTALKKVNPFKFITQWLDVSLQYTENALNISIESLGVKAPFYFVYYVKAKKIHIDGREFLSTGVLDQYKGQPKSIDLIGSRHRISLRTIELDSEVKIIPLQGEGDFWESNFLIAFHLNEKIAKLGWELSFL